MSDQTRHEGVPTEGLGEYVEQQLNYAGDTGEYAVANDELQRTMDEIAALEHERSGASPRPDIDRALSDVRTRLANLGRAGSAGQLEQGAATPVDYDRLSPENEARSQVMDDLGNATGQGNLRP